MPTLEKLRNKLSVLTNDAKELREKHTNSEGDVKFTDEARTEFKSLMNKIEDTKNQIKELEEELALNKSLDESLETVNAHQNSLNSDRTNNQRQSGVDLHGNTVQVTRHNADHDAQRGFRNHQEFLTCVLNHSLGRETDNRLNPLMVNGANDGHGTMNDPYGGFLVPEAFLPTELSIGPEADPTAGRTTQIPMTAPVVKINARVDKNHSTSVSGGLTVTRRAEQESIDYSNQERERITLDAHTLIGASFATNELIADSPVSLAALLEAGFRDEFASKIFDEKLNGTGAGQYEGVLNSPALITVAQEGSQNDTILGINLIKMRARCWGYGNAIWLANHDTYPQLIQAHIESATPAGVISFYQPSLRDDRPDILLGRPIFYTEYCSTLGDVGDIVLADWSQFLEGQIQGMKGETSTHVKFVTHEQVFKFTMRNDGRSWWKTALTPKNGATLSPFVTLAERAG